MSNPIIDGILDDLVKGVLEAAKTAGKNALEASISDTKDFLIKCLPRIQSWFLSYMTKEISEDEFKTLLDDLKSLALMNALTAAGLTEIEIDNTRNAILKTATNIITGAISKIV